MQKLKLDVLICNFAYAGNGGYSAVLPSYLTWFAKVNEWCKNDERIDRVAHKIAGDTPLPMERNRVVKEAKQEGFDVILMLDSDNIPDLYLGKNSRAKPFWETSFNFLYDRKLRGIPTVVCAPYCGPPPHPVNGGMENVYVFYAEGLENREPGAPHQSMKFEAYSREHAAIMSGISPIAAGPTGVIVYTTDAFDLMETRVDPRIVLEQYKAGQIDQERACQLLQRESWFYYEYNDAECTQKASTEDVTNTREIQMAGILKHNEPIVFCNWDAWAGHMKPKCVGAPNPLRIEQVSQVFTEAVRNNISAADKLIELDLPAIDSGPMVTEESLSPQREVVVPGVVMKRVYKRETCDALRAIIWHDAEVTPPRAIILNDTTGEVVLSVADADAAVSDSCIFFKPVTDDDSLRKQAGGLWGNLIVPVKQSPSAISRADLTAVVYCVNDHTFSAVSRAIHDTKEWVDNHLRKGGVIAFVGVSEETAAEIAEKLGSPEVSVSHGVAHILLENMQPKD